MNKCRFLLSCAIGMTAGTSALAADMPIKMAAAPAPAAYDWTGCFIGGNGGGATLSSGSTYAPDPSTSNQPFGSQNLFAALPASYDTGSRGSVAGGQIGCNFQSGRWVVGAEADLDAAHLSKSVGFIGPTSIFGTAIGPLTSALPTNSVFGNEQVSLRSLSTVRARIGLALFDRLDVYGTVGFALGTVSDNGSVIVGVTNPAGAMVVWSGSDVSNKVGLAFGGGGEYAVTDHWSIKGEYIHFDLGTVSHPLGLSFVNFAFASVYTTIGSTRTQVTGSFARGGLNYKF
jgi:outer membrane immunogenic protein